MLGDMNPTISPMAYTNGDPVNNIDLLGLYTESGGGQDNGGDDPGKGGGRLAGAPENEKYKGRSKEEVNAAEAAYAALKTFALSGAPAYNEMSPLRQTINDFANSSFVRTVNDWNPIASGVNLIYGATTGKNYYGTPMTGGDVSFAALGMIPGEGKVAEKIGIYVGKKAIVIGEGMYRIKPYAKSVGAKYYQAWSKYFPNGRELTEQELKLAFARNARWLKSKIKEGYKIYDIGIDATRKFRSEFYKLEKEILEKFNYPVSK